MKQRLQEATPQERAAFRKRLRERLEGMTPEQWQALAGRTRERWQQLASDEQQRIIVERRERVQSMSPEERRQLIQDRRDLLGKLGPEECARCAKNFQRGDALNERMNTAWAHAMSRLCGWLESAAARVRTGPVVPASDWSLWHEACAGDARSAQQLVRALKLMTRHCVCSCAR